MTDDWSAENRQLLGYRDLRGVDRVAEPTPAPAEPKRLGRYQVVAELGRGAMGTVYEAHDPRIDRIVAIKIISITGVSPSEAEAYRARFMREAQAAGRLSHPGIVTIYDVDEDPTSRTPYIVMEYMPGKRLDTFVEQLPSQRLTRETSLALAQQIAEALDYAHAQGIVHRDIKPGNVIVAGDGCAKIADFGIAKIALTEFTVPGQVLGTPSFMAPEQFLGAPVDGRADLFSLGIILYWMLTGVKPFTGESAASISFKLVYEDPAPATQVSPTLHPDFDTVLSRALAKDPAARYQSGKEFAQDLKRLRQGDLPKVVEASSSGPDRTQITGQAISQAMSRMLRSVATRTTDASTQVLGYLPELKRWAHGARFDLKWRLALAAFAVLIAAIGFDRIIDKRGGPTKTQSLRAANTAIEPVRTTPASAMSASVPPIHSEHKSVLARAGTGLRGVTTRKVQKPLPTKTAAPAQPTVQPIPAVQSNATAEAIEKLQPISAVESTPKVELIGKATLLTVGEHPFRNATLSISVDGALAYRGSLTGVRKLPFGAIRGTVSEAIHLTPGPHLVEVHVVSEHDHFDESKKIEGQVQANELKTLVIAFAGHPSDMRLAWK
jgi:eukaryotic-like serine/threonine-protein kinase